MKRLALCTIVATLSLTLSGLQPAEAARKQAAKTGKKAAPASNAPNANAAEIDKLKGEFKWGMSVEEVQTALEKRLRDSYADNLKKALKDPTQYSRMRSQVEKEVKALKANHVKFEGRKTGYDVSIVDEEFAHNTGESMTVARDDKNTRYYFFADGRLYKIFIAFGKEILEDKTFTDFGALMQARFGKAKAVMVEETKKAGVASKLDHYEWAAANGDGLRLVDRSEFYDVYCLVIYDRKESDRLAEHRVRTNPKRDGRDSLVEAALGGDRPKDDVNANIMDQIAGKNYAKPGQNAPADIVVPTNGAPPPVPARPNQIPGGKTAGPAPSASPSGSSGKKAGGKVDLEL